MSKNTNDPNPEIQGSTDEYVEGLYFEDLVKATLTGMVMKEGADFGDVAVGHVTTIARAVYESSRAEWGQMLKDGLVKGADE